LLRKVYSTDETTIPDLVVKRGLLDLAIISKKSLGTSRGHQAGFRKLWEANELD